MKISKLFHWLYASVMFLPLLVAPIFGIYAHRHVIDTYAIDVPQNEVVYFNQLVNPLNKTANIETYENYVYTTTTIPENAVFIANYVNVVDGHKYFLRYENLNGTNTGIDFYTGSSYLSQNSNTIYTSDYNGRLDINVLYYDIGLRFEFKVNVFDLTQMFGVGNEPSATDFNNAYLNQYFDYIQSKKELLKGISTTTYDDTDIGSQFIYSLYFTTDKYLNFDQVLNLGAISDWINLNVFNGNAPIVYYIVWHYLDYWLILSIFWLCFDVLIYVPQIAHRWLDKAQLE